MTVEVPDVKYYECHITTEPLTDKWVRGTVSYALPSSFKLSTLLLAKGDGTFEMSEKDSFITGRGGNLAELQAQAIEVLALLARQHIQVWRVKFEAAISDVKFPR